MCYAHIAMVSIDSHKVLHACLAQYVLSSILTVALRLQPRAFGFLNPVDSMVLVSNLCIASYQIFRSVPASYKLSFDV